MNNISPIAWVFIGFIVIFTISINIWLFTAKNKPQKNKNDLIFNRMIQTIQDPFAEEKINLQKLSEATAKLRESSTKEEN
ncbi:MAG: hypothetical protein CL609_12140 [Anaerolineaceae bacterium]|nr:hypothetical protein [Anaerolineaceae bacterium]